MPPATIGLMKLLSTAQTMVIFSWHPLTPGTKVNTDASPDLSGSFFDTENAERAKIEKRKAIASVGNCDQAGAGRKS